ncbi:MAG TPA: hypothetical protein EYP49_20050 [Anaerolineae bacterium]|nr:hypothetical protein [Anaerolineae bacterium]
MPTGEEYVGREPASAQVHFEEVDVDLLAFVKRYATGAVKWDIIAFFGENPYTSDTAESIAQRIGRSLDTVLPELIDLAMVGLLERIEIGEAVVFQLTQEQALRQTTSNFVRHFRDHVRQAPSPPDTEVPRQVERVTF